MYRTKRPLEDSILLGGRLYEAQILPFLTIKFSRHRKDPLYFLPHEKAVKHNLSIESDRFGLRKNIEERILKDTIANLHKVRNELSEYEITDIILSLVLDDANQEKSFENPGRYHRNGYLRDGIGRRKRRLFILVPAVIQLVVSAHPNRRIQYAVLLEKIRVNRLL